MDANTVTALIAIATVAVAVALVIGHFRRRAAFEAGLAQRGLHVTRAGDATTVSAESGDWTVTMTRSFVSQMSPPGTHIVVSTWTSPTPHATGAALIVGPAPPQDLRDLTEALIGTAGPATSHWLGIDRVSGGRPMQPVAGVDQRLLALATPGYRVPGTLTAVAVAISGWCSSHPSEREQPAVTVDESGMSVRVRTDVLRSLDLVDDFIELGLRCREGMAP